MSIDIDSFWEDQYRKEHQDKTDEELRQIVLNNSKKVTALPTSATPTMVAEAKKWLAESKACNAIMKARNEARASRREAIKKWKDGQDNAKMKAILNLPTGITPNGQLVAAILEDEETSMTAQEIAGWCDELGELEEADLQSLLDGLQRERIIGCKDNKYFLRQAVTETLYPETTYLTVAQLGELIGETYATEAYLALQMIEGEGHPLTLEDMKNELSGYSYLKTIFPEEGLTDEDFEWVEYDYESGAIPRLTAVGLLTRLYLSGHTFYYYPMIGSKPPMKDLEGGKRPGGNVNTENMTEIQKQNESIKDAIYAYMSQLDEGELVTITDVMESCAEAAELSNQRVSALIRQLVTDGALERIEQERKAYFRVKK